MKILCITPVKHIPGVCEILESAGEVAYMDDPSSPEVWKRLRCGEYDAIFTNPNKSKVYISVLDTSKVSIIATASTGTDHIAMEAAAEYGTKVLSLAKEYDTINQISSTAEHAFALMMCGLRHIPAAAQSVKDGEWDYEPFIGRQLRKLTVGIIGLGRLGSQFGWGCVGFGAKILYYDPRKDSDTMEEVLRFSDVISLHVHLTDETRHMVNEKFLSQVKDDVVIVNTSRGDIVDEEAMIEFLNTHHKAFYATDVIHDESGERPLVEFATVSDQILITPHIGGMTREGQQIAYTRMAEMLKEELCAMSSQKQG
jgi:D-3-phosphoglycerate dehydrogenase